ncbi:MAG: hypothetical protein ACHQIL_03875 [Steroidobacterales bacterium]
MQRFFRIPRPHPAEPAPLTGWLSQRFGAVRLFVVSIGFVSLAKAPRRIASALVSDATH